MAPQTPDYGIDAPYAVRNLLIAAALGMTAFLTAHWGLWSGIVFYFAIKRIGLAAAIGCGFMAAWMIYDSKIGKLKEREMLLDLAELHPGDRVLDVGCGRGLLLIGAARRLPEGHATGLDLWNAEDLSGNNPDATRENARLEGVEDRVHVETGDMRKMPFPDSTFDAIVSSMAIHNIYNRVGRREAIYEFARVLKPGGRIVINDIRHIAEYRKGLSDSGMTKIQYHSTGISSLIFGIMTFGAVRPGLLTARRPD